MKREVSATMWVLGTLAVLVLLACVFICVLGLVTYQVAGHTQ